MASEDHLKLSTFIKEVHQNLRKECREVGPELAWAKHCSNLETLNTYALAMKELASVHWERNNRSDASVCRISWVVKESEEYFRNGGELREIERECRLANRYVMSLKLPQALSVPTGELKVLDVGSCYNPFKVIPSFIVTAIDLVPASDDVLTCDFLSLEIGVEFKKDHTNRVVSLPKESYDAVIFSLVLEYLPTPQQRLAFVMKATALLRAGGLLFILTPDSKHATANSSLMKRWKLALGKLGLWRIRYQKLKHLHCMAFRKCLDSRIAEAWFYHQKCQLSLDSALAIPQDSFSFSEPSTPPEEYTPENSCIISENFTELPGDNLF